MLCQFAPMSLVLPANFWRHCASVLLLAVRSLGAVLFRLRMHALIRDFCENPERLEVVPAFLVIFYSAARLVLL
jgi:hypothetical protein